MTLKLSPSISHLFKLFYNSQHVQVVIKMVILSRVFPQNLRTVVISVVSVKEGRALKDS